MSLIENESQYEEILVRIYQLMQVEMKNAEEINELEKLVVQVEEYESIHYPIPKPQQELVLKRLADYHNNPEASDFNNAMDEIDKNL